MKTFILPKTIRTRKYLNNLSYFNQYIKNVPSSIYFSSFDYKYGKKETQAELPIPITETKKWQLDNIRMASKVPFILDGFFQTLYINKTRIPFFASDNSVINKSHFYFRNYYLYEVSFKNTIKWILIPLNPKICLLLFKPIDILLPPYLTKIEIINEKSIYEINDRIIYNAEKEVMMKSYNRFMLKMTIVMNPTCLSKKKIIINC